ncbi:MAG: type II secretion system F family protein, partial [Acidimicrobiia bacterium]|nr:type II secretion system F family protein [Acidimicrobiia bacterium]
VAVLATVVLVGFIYMFVNGIASRDRKKFEDQLPGVLGLLATSLRSGQSFLQAMEAVASEAAQPTAREYNRAVAEVRLGRTVGTALKGISERMNSSDFQWVVISTEIQREVGGNLAEVLDIVSDTMLQRTRLRREVRALSAEGRFSAGILLLMPIFLVMFLFVNNRPYLMQLTSSTTGWTLVGVSLGLMAAAIAWVRKIVDIEI